MSATATTGAPCVLHLELAGRAMTIEALDDAAVAAVSPALGHLATGRPDPEAMRFRIWSDDAGPHALWHADAPSLVRLGAQGLAAAHRSPASLELFEPGRGIELWGTRAAFASGDTRAHPASTATAAWIAAEGAQVLHAGAVVFDHAAALLIGSAGAGKSTTAIACALAGGRILGDDLCVVECDGETSVATVHALYASLKINSDSGARLGIDGWPSLGTTPKGKRVLAIEAPLRLQSSAPVGAVIVLRPPGAGPALPTRLTAGEAVRALVPTALYAALGAGALGGWFKTTLQLARTVPAYELALSWDLPHVVSGVASTIARAG